MLFEGLLNLSRRITGDLLVAASATIAYLLSIVWTLMLLLMGHATLPGPAFHVTVGLLVGWTGWKWLTLARSTCLPSGTAHTLPPERQH